MPILWACGLAATHKARYKKRARERVFDIRLLTTP